MRAKRRAAPLCSTSLPARRCLCGAPRRHQPDTRRNERSWSRRIVSPPSPFSPPSLCSCLSTFPRTGCHYSDRLAPCLKAGCPPGGNEGERRRKLRRDAVGAAAVTASSLAHLVQACKSFLRRIAGDEERVRRHEENEELVFGIAHGPAEAIFSCAQATAVKEDGLVLPRPARRIVRQPRLAFIVVSNSRPFSSPLPARRTSIPAEALLAGHAAALGRALDGTRNRSVLASVRFVEVVDKHVCRQVLLLELIGPFTVIVRLHVADRRPGPQRADPRGASQRITAYRQAYVSVKRRRCSKGHNAARGEHSPAAMICGGCEARPNPESVDNVAWQLR